MAYDAYRSPAADQPSFFDLNDERYGQPMQKTHSDQSPVEYERVRPQPSATVKPREAGFAQAQQPINDAVTSAFDKADTANAISPELLNQITSQITANVIQQLKTTNLNAHLNAEQSAPIPNAAVLPPSPSTQPATSPTATHRNLYTPPSPHRPEEDISPPSSFTQTKYSHPAHGHSPPIRPAPSPSSQASHASENAQRDTKNDYDTRPKGPISLSTGENATLVEKAWGQLYDENGKPTARLGQFLRGIANHLIEDFEPTNSLVVTPAKMQQFYKDTALAGEIYPWHVIFDDRTSSISRLYREIGAVHHLIQEDERYDERPDIPGLTPQGFQTWMIMSFLANPEHEFERLQKVVREMPISNADDRKDRFPKDISRRLFPAQREVAIKEKIEKAMVTHCNIKLPVRDHKEPEVVQDERKLEPTVPRTEPMSSSTGGLERERQPYSATPSVAASFADEEEDMPTPQPIERERKPYSSQPGAGKTYEDFNKPTTLPPPVASASILNKSTVSAVQTSVPDSKEPTPGRSRAYSTTSSNRYEPVQHPSTAALGPKTRPIPIVSNSNRPPGGLPPSSYDTAANGAPDHLHPRTGSINRTRSTRNRSPSVNDTYRSSEPNFSASSQSGGYSEPRERERDYERGPTFRDDTSRMSMYEIGSSGPGRERSRYRFEGGGSVSSGNGSAIPPSHPYYPSQVGGRDVYTSDEDRYRAGAARAPPLSGTPGSGYDQYGGNPNNYYK